MGYSKQRRNWRYYSSSSGMGMEDGWIDCFRSNGVDGVSILWMDWCWMHVSMGAIGEIGSGRERGCWGTFYIQVGWQVKAEV